MSIAPHGGTLVDRFLTGAALDEAKKKAATLPKVKVDAYAAFDIDGIAKGIFSPLTGFMNEEQTRSVMDRMILRPGVVWSIPILLSVSQETADATPLNSEVAIEDDRGEVVAIMTVSDKFSIDKQELAQKVYRTTEDKHPGVAYTYSHGPVYFGGDIWVLKAREVEHAEYNLTPAQTRELFKEKGWKRIVAFQTRNPIHRAHEYLTKCALEICDGLLIHPLMGTTKNDDIPGDVRMKCYQALLANYYSAKNATLSIMPVNMRYAGPREAIMHAIYRQNYGCTHFIVGRDHAGVGNYYGSYDAHYIFDEIEPGGLAITPIFFEHTFFCKACGNMASIKTCPHDKEQHVALSGTKVREMLAAKIEPPVEFTRAEIARELFAWASSN